jgi:hypothetical protein
VFTYPYPNNEKLLVNFINILRPAFAPIFLRQKKFQSRTVTKEKAAKKLFCARKVSSKILLTLTLGQL